MNYLRFNRYLVFRQIWSKLSSIGTYAKMINSRKLTNQFVRKFYPCYRKTRWLVVSWPQTLTIYQSYWLLTTICSNQNKWLKSKPYLWWRKEDSKLNLWGKFKSVLVPKNWCRKSKSKCRSTCRGHSRSVRHFRKLKLLKTVICVLNFLTSSWEILWTTLTMISIAH